MGRHPIDWHPQIAFGNQKGGTGKTTATINSAAALATRNHDVLAIDMRSSRYIVTQEFLEPVIW